MPQAKSERSIGTRASSAGASGPASAAAAASSSSSRTATHGPSPYARNQRRSSGGGGGHSSDEVDAPRPPPPPRSNRQQYSACGACRMRRVKCDLKEMAVVALPGIRPVCSNCKERSINCVFTVVAGGDQDPLPSGDVSTGMFDNSKPGGKQKLLRRGRRIQGAEAIFGKVTDHLFTEPPSIIPELSVDFFNSAFFRRFQLQRPIIDPTEFGTRYGAYAGGDRTALDSSGLLVAKLLVVWAHAFGHNETGAAALPQDVYIEPSELGQRRAEWAHRTREMLDEVLRGIDHHGLLRRPSWDGVRALLLLLPLLADNTQANQQPLERIALIEGAISHAYALCSHGSAPAGGDHIRDALVRARVFWYAYVYEGTTSGLRGGRLVLAPEDVDLFQQTLPRIPLSPPPVLPPSASAFEAARRQADILIDIANACRAIHTCLTGPRARQRQGLLDERTLTNAWTQLDFGWTTLEHLRATGVVEMTDDELNTFVSSWQMFIFESYNITRELLKRRLATHDPATSGVPGSPGVYEQAMRLHQQSLYQCNNTLSRVLDVIRRNLHTPFFAYDAALVRDAAFYAAILLASADSAGAEDELRADVELCLAAMREMRFAFSRADDRERSVEHSWQRRQQRLEAEAASSGHMSAYAAGASVPVSTAPPPPLAYSMYPAVPPMTGYTSTPPGSAHSRPSTAGGHPSSGLVGYPNPSASPLEHNFAYEYSGAGHDRVGLGLPAHAGSSSGSILPAPSNYMTSGYPMDVRSAPGTSYGADWTSQSSHIHLPPPTDSIRRH